jgi:hypothetical protein
VSVTTRIRVAVFCLVAVLGTGLILAGEAVQVTVVSDSGDRVVLQYKFGAYRSDVVKIEGREYHEISFPGEPVFQEKGSPALPHVNRSIIIPDDARMDVRVISSDYQEIRTAIAPSKGNLYRTVDPGAVPYVFGDAYGADAFYPGPLATLGRPYVLREHRGITVQVNPFQYNPRTGLLRVYSEIVVEVEAVGSGEVNVLGHPGDVARPSMAFRDIYGSHFLNFTDSERYEPINEIGDMLILCHDEWIPNMAPFVAHKSSIGMNTTIVGISTIGNSHPAILSYIQGVYDTSNLAFVLLVGDIAQIDSPTVWGGASDASYSKLAGDDDYPEIIVGRFSAGTPADVDTQVERTIEYETLPANETDWFWRGIGLASTEGAGQGDEGQSDDVHMAEIRDWLLAAGYTEVDGFYGSSATSAQVAAALNEGRGILNYCGHGSPSGFSTSGFSSTDVDALTNDNMLPFVQSVACNTGEFENYDSCFAETWMRATHNGEPTGAIAIYASSISQSWAPPMEAEDEFNLLLTDPTEPYFSYGAMCYAGSSSMMDDYGTGGVEMFDTWVLFGDPSLRLIGRACSDAGRVTLDRPEYACEDTVEISVLDCNLNTDDQVVETVVVDVDSGSETGVETVTLVEANANSANFQGSIPVSETDGDGVLLVADGDTITVTYVDPDDGEGGTNVVVTAEATVDCTSPVITNVQVADVGPLGATVTFETDEPTRGVVDFGASCGELTSTAVGTGFASSVAVGLSGLQENTTYFFIVHAYDHAGNATTDDNGGQCYSFTTTDIPNFFTEQFTSGLDLDGFKLTFTPDGSIDFYSACVEPITALPTDPTGGVEFILTDDDEGQAVLADGKTVAIYGVSYPSFWVVSNGYVTFNGGETGYTETYASHFSVERVSALFDDLNPSTGGTVSWKQLDDRAVATWENVPELGGSGANTFQIELFFDGTITISQLGITCSDAIVGLSAGGGLSPVFFPSDLSEAGACGPRPPSCVSAEVTTLPGTPVVITLQASDDGLPDPPGLMSCAIVSLPAHGSLEDPGAGSIIDVPYTLVDHGTDVIYVPAPGHEEPCSFQFQANDGGVAPDGGDSNIATVTVVQDLMQVLFDFPMDTDPGWGTTGQWAFGIPTGAGTHNLDPTNGFTGENVLGYNLEGDYPDNMGEEYLTTPPFDLSGATQTSVDFCRWLGVESSTYDHAAFQISTDGATWTDVWTHAGGAISESAWSIQAYDISAIADNQPAVSLRWVMGTTDTSVTYPGWNIDDVRIRGVGPSQGCLAAPGAVGQLFFWDDTMTLDWMPPAEQGGQVAPTYDVIRADVADGFASDAVCIETDDGTNTYAIDPEQPPANGAFYYLVRAENACGAGSLGHSSSGAERTAIDCVP